MMVCEEFRSTRKMSLDNFGNRVFNDFEIGYTRALKNRCFVSF